ncbi:MAG: response regulator [Gammaproteobacteria bacterium]|nr:response regulator [Gammaproteobacteria bacterium]
MDKTFKVTLFGLAPNEQKTLGSIFKLAASRSTKYALVAEANRATAELAIVDADDPKAMEAWQSFSAQNGGVWLIKATKGAAKPGEACIRRPLTLKRVLESLDAVSAPLKPIDDKAEAAGSKFMPTAAAPAIKPPTGPSSGLKAMVIDDAEVVRKSMEIHLGSFGIQIDFAESGEEALEHTKTKSDYDIIFLDIMMPGIDGYKVCKTLRAKKEFKRTPIIMLTGKGSRFDKLKGTMAGASLYLTKPVEPDHLKEVITKFLPQLAKGTA